MLVQPGSQPIVLEDVRLIKTSLPHGVLPDENGFLKIAKEAGLYNIGDVADRHMHGPPGHQVVKGVKVTTRYGAHVNYYFSGGKVVLQGHYEAKRQAYSAFLEITTPLPNRLPSSFVRPLQAVMPPLPAPGDV